MKYLNAFLKEAGEGSKKPQEHLTQKPSKPPKALLTVLTVGEPRSIEKTSPIKPGWTVAYRGPSGLIEGSTVIAATPRGDCGWTFQLANGIKLRHTEIFSVAAVENGHWRGAWTVKDWGLDGGLLSREAGIF